MKYDHFLTGTLPPERLTLTELAGLARHEEFQPRRLAEAVGLSLRTFARRFRQAFGSSTRAWLAAEQMQEAAVLLARGRSGKEVAGVLGYRHLPSFCREFRRYFGCTTTEWHERFNTGQQQPYPAGEGALSRNANLLSRNANPLRLRVTVAA